ncbi:hypothetical protein FB45DRAFT_944424 [Roridomyces roridus]|uniref:Uncharacterized protein n=1 Tax=Roridomyces roridus TaxID=1738132 RepID=A0AAD7B357_9AGAR|nr:hypothetical protein FB45DRAFT_944424 [Roridomyces roridus]
MGWRGFLGVLAYIALLVIFHYPTAMWLLGKLAKTGQWAFAPLRAARPGDAVPTPGELESGHGCDSTEAPVDDHKAPIAPIPTATPAVPLPDHGLPQPLSMSLYSFVAFILFLLAMGSYLMIALDVVSLKDKSFVDNVLSVGWAMLEGLEVLFVGVMGVYVGMRMRMLCVRGQ